jgi:hypothetical protein
VLKAASEPSKVAEFTKDAAPVMQGLGPRRNLLPENQDGPGSFVPNPRPSFKKGLLKGADKGLFIAGLSDAVLALAGVQGRNVARVAGEREAHLDREQRRQQLFEQREQRRTERAEDQTQREEEIDDAAERQKERDQRAREHEADILELEQKGLKLRAENDTRLSVVGDAYENLTRYGIGKLPNEYGDPVDVANDPRKFAGFMRFIGDARETQRLAELEASEKAAGGSGKLTKGQQDALAKVRSSAMLFAQGYMPADPEDQEGIPNQGFLPLPGTDPQNLQTVQSKAMQYAAGIEWATPQDFQEAKQAFEDGFIREFEIFNSVPLGQLTDSELTQAEMTALRAQASSAFVTAATEVQRLKNQPPPPRAEPGPGLLGRIPAVQQFREAHPSDPTRPDSSRSQTRASRILETSKKGRVGMRSAIEEFRNADSGTQAALEQLNPDLVAFMRARM